MNLKNTVKLIIGILCISCLLLIFASCTKPSIENPDTSTDLQTDPTTNNTEPSTEETTGSTEPSTEETVGNTEPTPLTLPEGTPLTADEIAWFYGEFFVRDWFDEEPEWLYNIRNKYLQIEFATTDEIDFSLLFSNGVRPTKEPVTQEELDAFQQATGRTVSKEVIKLTRRDLEFAFVHTTAENIPFSHANGYDELIYIGSDKLIYLKEYDAYYIECVDSVEPAYTIKEGVKLRGGQLVMLLYESKLGDSTTDWIVTLHGHKGTYVFESNLPTGQTGPVENTEPVNIEDIEGPLAQYVQTAVKETLELDTTKTGNGEQIVHVRLPKLLPFSEDAVTAQAEIKSEFDPWIEEIRTNFADGWSSSTHSIDYEAYLNGSVFSLMICAESMVDLNSYFVYNFDVETGKRLNTEELMSKLQMPDYTEKFTQIAQKAFDGKYDGATAEFLERERDRIAAKREETISRENIDKAMPYVAADGKVMVVIDIHFTAGAGCYPEVFSVS